MTQQCIACQHFTLKPRTDEGQAHLTASDVAHAKVGMGRCVIETISLRWISPEATACGQHKVVSEKQEAVRREWMRGRNAR